MRCYPSRLWMRSKWKKGNWLKWSHHPLSSFMSHRHDECIYCSRICRNFFLLLFSPFYYWALHELSRVCGINHNKQSISTKYSNQKVIFLSLSLSRFCRQRLSVFVFAHFPCPRNCALFDAAIMFNCTIYSVFTAINRRLFPFRSSAYRSGFGVIIKKFRSNQSQQWLWYTAKTMRPAKEQTWIVFHLLCNCNDIN